MVKKLVFSFFMLSSILGLAQQTKTFPEITGELLTGKTFTIPLEADYQAFFVGMAYSKNAEEDLETWFQPTFDKFILKKGLFDGTYHVQPLFVPMFTGFNKAAEKSVSKSLIEQIPTEFKNNVLVYRGSLEPYKSELNMDDKNIPYLFLVTPAGKILYVTKGAFTEKKMEKIADILDQL
jgi:hypothetical protein